MWGDSGLQMGENVVWLCTAQVEKNGKDCVNGNGTSGVPPNPLNHVGPPRHVKLYLVHPVAEYGKREWGYARSM